MMMGFMYKLCILCAKIGKNFQLGTVHNLLFFEVPCYIFVVIAAINIFVSGSFCVSKTHVCLCCVAGGAGIIASVIGVVCWTLLIFWVLVSELFSLKSKLVRLTIVSGLTLTCFFELLSWFSLLSCSLVNYLDDEASSTFQALLDFQRRYENRFHLGTESIYLLKAETGRDLKERLLSLDLLRTVTFIVGSPVPILANILGAEYACDIYSSLLGWLSISLSFSDTVIVVFILVLASGSSAIILVETK